MISTPAGEVSVPDHFEILRDKNEVAWAAVQDCHGGCGRRIATPLLSRNPDGTTRLPDFGPHRCLVCGPFPGSAAEAALESQKRGAGV